MSYNTRRTGGGGPDRNSNRAPQTTQVNYHTQAAKPAAQNPNVVRGYTTTNTQSYNSAAQPAYSTPQPAYQTNPPLPKTVPPQQAAAPATPQQVKQELVTPQGTPAASENGDTSSSKPFWATKKKSATKLSNKVKKQRQNAKLRRILNPKTALTFLNELKPGGIKFTTKEEPGWGFSASIEIDGNTYIGHGLTVSKAKVQASEQALRDMLLEKMSKSAEVKEEKKEEEAKQDESMETDEGGEPKAKKRPPPPEDDLPWGSLAAFALHKLFMEWQRGATELPKEYEDEMSEDPFFARRGPSPGDFGGYPRRFGPPRAGPYPPPRGFGPFPPRGPPPFMGGMPPRRAPATLPFGVKQPSIMPMKKIPDDAHQKHPVMLLNQLKPDVTYKESKEGQAPNIRFIISVELEGKQYSGEGKNKKEAKKNAAKQVLNSLGIPYAEGD